ncbi:hypothetical protein BEWA_028650 [Theileria equi strain WA]|uniref:Signal peptide containing protein n=1 Tax=Theileria equi strain WA TaxID=1537102 RepID=L0AWU0_THEEQ|nr:hypothetical protein BEWA_028650 [Theileria equi strain WA]AFZ80015.1 hypothetical protein BEWA_028650 [Theileria equi strain WA]|eukprot:XP_004829681.1 hypothetical protein BEWA_028650 [Theileria equi strain WA]
MRLFSLLYIILLIKLVRSTKKKITFHLLEPDIFQVTLDVREDSGLEIKKYTPRKGFRINKVKDGDKDLWKSRWIHKDGCKSIQFHSKGETRLVALWVVNNNDTLDIKRFNKVGDKWEKIELEGFNQKIREAKSQEAGSNEGTRPTPVADYKSKVDSTLFDVRESTIDGPFYLTCTPKPNTVVTKLVYGGNTIWDGGKKALFLSALIYLDEYKPRLATLSKKENGKDQTIFLHEDGGSWKEDKAIHTRKLTILKETYGKTRPKKKTIWRETTSELTQELSSLHTTSEEPKGVSPQVPKAPTTPKQTTPVPLNLSNPDKSKVVVYDQYSNEIKTKKYSPRDNYHISSVMEGEVEVWKVDDPNTKCRIVRGYAKDGIEILYLHIDCNGSPNSKHFEKKNGAWHEMDINTYDKKLKEIRGEPEEPEEPVSPFLDKVDTSLFDLEESLEGDVPVLKLTAKDETHELTYGGEVLWEDKKKLCSSAVLYLDGEKPTLAVVDFKDKKKVVKVYLHHDGKQWKKGNERDHNSKLTTLKEKCKPVITPTPSPGNTTKPVTSQANAPKPTTPFKLDITNPDRTKITINDINNTGLPCREYVAQGGYHISSVLDGKINLWIAPKGEICIAVKSFIQDAVTIIAIFIKDGDTKRRKCIEKAGGRWKDIDGQTFEEKLKAIREERVAGNEGAGNDGSPFTLLPPEQITSKQNAENHTENMVNAYASEILGAPAKKPKVVPRAESANEGIATDEPENVTEDTEPQVQSKSTNCTLDLSKPDEDEISVKENKNYGGGVTQKDFSPKEGFKIDYILNNGTPVIKLSEGEEFRSIRLYSKRSSHILMLTINKGQTPEHQYYEKIAGDWYKLKDKSEFNVRLNAMKGSG